MAGEPFVGSFGLPGPCCDCGKPEENFDVIFDIQEFRLDAFLGCSLTCKVFSELGRLPSPGRFGNALFVRRVESEG